MKNMSSLEFVLTHFQEGRFHWKQGYRAVCGRQRFRLAPWLSAAAAIAVFAFLFTGYQNRTTYYRAYDVAQMFTLPDGSRVELQPGAELSLKPHRAPRRITLEQGTALFRVTKLEGKPFTVKTASSFVQVLGTVFRLSDTQLEVLEGQVLYKSAPDSTGIVVTAGESARIMAGVPEKIRKVFVFDATPLEKVLAELADYYGVALSCPCEGKKLTATFSDEDSLEVIIGLIESALDIDISLKK